MGSANFQVLWEDGERIFCRRASHANNGDRSAVLAVFPLGNIRPPATLIASRTNMDWKDELDGAWAVRPLT